MDRLSFANIFPANILLSLCLYIECKVTQFFCENANFKNFAKISPTKISRHTVFPVQEVVLTYTVKY